jgi:hypothetical protein
MSLICCPSCRLRFTSAAAAYLVACPECGRVPQPIASAADVLGFRLCIIEDLPYESPEAVAAWLAVPDLDGERP